MRCGHADFREKIIVLCFIDLRSFLDPLQLSGKFGAETLLTVSREVGFMTEVGVISEHVAEERHRILLEVANVDMLRNEASQ